MNTVETSEKINVVITPEELLKHWEGHRGLTRRLIEVFPEKEFFEHSIGGMRPAAQLIQEMMDVSTGGVREMAGGDSGEIAGHGVKATSIAEALDNWDKDTAELFENLAKIPVEKFHERILSFGQYEGTIWGNIFYFLDNEIHHRAQAYVYLRSLGIEPPAFWDRY
ncbi:DinB family protein [Daejeonella sp. JGW-45]|uniref:DinB family protein n=1 Tax=Daejeonella sp. JGW-45 TaxID=3034148 RepID=UPI0023ED7D8F|nr:DinB family protein [Daejeonella sp. JGW-45]